VGEEKEEKERENGRWRAVWLKQDWWLEAANVSRLGEQAVVCQLRLGGFWGLTFWVLGAGSLESQRGSIEAEAACAKPYHTLVSGRRDPGRFSGGKSLKIQGLATAAPPPNTTTFAVCVVIRNRLDGELIFIGNGILNI
jgi:hypothetical protein